MLTIIHVAIPAFILLLLVEVYVNWRGHHDWYQTKDTFSSLAMGIGSQIVGLFAKGIVVFVFAFLFKNRLFEIPMNAWWAWLLLFFADDLAYYWFHRISHGVRWFWASHVIHHSSEHYNLGTALRQTWTGDLAGGFLFYAGLPLLGFPLPMIFTMQAISLLYQFWIHTEGIHRMPRWFEYLFNTPSHHRVHHGSDLKYLDKNHGGILIIWDRLFGTFQAEEERPHYGLTKNLDTYNPIRIATHEWVDLFKAATSNPRYFFQYLFNPPGWSHDGSTKTTEQLRAEAQQHSGPSLTSQ